MDFELSAEQRDIVAAFDRALSRESSIERVRAAEKAGFDPDLWRVIVDMGALGVVQPAGAGGSGSGAVELSLIAESLGRHLGCVPLVEAAAATVLLAESGVPVASGSAGDGLIVFAPRPAQGGVAQVTAGAAAAEGIVVLDGADLVLAIGAVAEPVDDLGFTGAASVRLDEPGVERTVLARDEEAYASWLGGVARWHAGTAAVLVGIAEEALRVAVEYATVREQFGVPIGSFQAIQHTLAEVAIEVDGARLLSRAAAWSLDHAEPDRGGVATAAYAFASDVAVRAAEACLHVHGGYGFTLEYDAQLFLRRARALRLHGGDPEQLWEAVGAATMAKAQ
ncbi:MULTISPECIES: acyl-CoA dehydrogenase family protein [Mumia]|uniref:Acyl-CoA dehydrogenase family protein n=1 Tax=Mumia xiangluensis TaxID=1678900 RepID=A0ABW1QHM4_9ACTN|nr:MULTISPECIES: acyl-CoA dehydrogenase [Mumia]